ncbi:hypothetical protein HZC20_02755 [Candidatus Peregrinibacteria bacterium]|nr:hypothetical protein [Candidatus Peregrinibacteria bacterium]
MFNLTVRRAFTTAVATVGLDFIFHYFLTNPMETLTYFVVKFLLAFFVAAFLFGLKSKEYFSSGFMKFVGFIFGKKSSELRSVGVLWMSIVALAFSTLMSAYYRAWEIFEAYVPIGERAPDIFGIARENILLFSAAWWVTHALFFFIGAIVSSKFIKD